MAHLSAEADERNTRGTREEHERTAGWQKASRMGCGADRKPLGAHMSEHTTCGEAAVATRSALQRRSASERRVPAWGFQRGCGWVSMAACRRSAAHRCRCSRASLARESLQGPRGGVGQGGGCTARTCSGATMGVSAAQSRSECGRAAMPHIGALRAIVCAPGSCRSVARRATGRAGVMHAESTSVAARSALADEIMGLGPLRHTSTTDRREVSVRSG